MGSDKFRTKISVEDYLEGEKGSDIKYEFINGEVYAMAGASDNHNRIAGNLFAALFGKLRDSVCEPFMTDMKLKADEAVFYYPDVSVVCDENPVNSFYREEPVLHNRNRIAFNSPNRSPRKAPRISTNAVRSGIRHHRTGKNQRRN